MGVYVEFIINELSILIYLIGKTFELLYTILTLGRTDDLVETFDLTSVLQTRTSPLSTLSHPKA